MARRGCQQPVRCRSDHGAADYPYGGPGNEPAAASRAGAEQWFSLRWLAHRRPCRSGPVRVYQEVRRSNCVVGIKFHARTAAQTGRNGRDPASRVFGRRGLRSDPPRTAASHTLAAAALLALVVSGRAEPPAPVLTDVAEPSTSASAPSPSVESGPMTGDELVGWKPSAPCT